MIKITSILIILALTGHYISIPVEQRVPKFDLSSIMSLLPHGNNAGANTNSMSLSDIMKLLELVKQLNDLKGELTAIPQSIVTALNSTANLLNSQGINLTTINQMNQNQITGKRNLYERFDLSSIMSLLPHGNNAGANTNSMSLSDIMKLLELVKQLNDLKGELTAIPQSIVTALNSTANLLNSQGINLTTINQMNQNQITGKRALQLY